MKGKTKEQKGITLVALIITIVVLLILAVVSINSIQNDGIISKAESAGQKFNEEQSKEQSIFQGYEDLFTELEGGFEAYTIGDEVTIGTEEFWVIENSAETNANVVLLAKQAIDTTNLVQSSSANSIAFSASMYWSTGGNISETDLDSTHYAAYAAYQYGLKLGGTGKLLTANVASGLTDYTSILGSASTWLGSAYGTDGDIYILIGDGSFNSRYTSYSNTFCVRPVVVISKSKIS